MTKEELQRYEELRMFGERLDDRIKKLEKEPEIFEQKIKPYEDIKHYPLLKVDKLYPGLPIYDTSTTTNHIQGEIYITKIGSTSSICSFIDGVQKKVNLT